MVGTSIRAGPVAGEVGGMSANVRVGFQGELGAFSEEAVRELIPRGEPTPHPSFEAVVRAVERGENSAGVLPVENTLAGTVARAYDALTRGDVSVVAVSLKNIRLCLLASSGATVDGLRELRSHPVALDQCRGFLAAHPDITARAVYDTAGAAQEVAVLENPAVAAAASAAAAERYGLDVLARDVQDRQDNQTRFYHIVRSTDVVPGAPPLKTACIAETENRPGALHGLLGSFAGRGLDLTHITSRPAKTPWTYRFILEFTHMEPGPAERALKEARGRGARVRVLGTFSAWKPRKTSG
jgi:prephenate dehydratase